MVRHYARAASDAPAQCWNQALDRLDAIVAAGWLPWVTKGHECACRLWRDRCPGGGNRLFGGRADECPLYLQLELPSLSAQEGGPTMPLDHYSFWTLGARLDAVVGQPYWKPERESGELDGKFDLPPSVSVTFDRRASWWYPGRTTCVILSRSPERFPHPVVEDRLANGLTESG